MYFTTQHIQRITFRCKSVFVATYVKFREPYEEKMRKLREIIDPISFRASEIEKRRLVGSGVVKMERQVQRALSQVCF